MEARLRRELEEKVRAGGRLDREDGVALYGSDDLAWLGGLADAARARRHGDRAHFAAVADGAEVFSYGAEDPADRVDALLALRERQDAGEGPRAVAPVPAGRVTGGEVLKLFAVARLLLDNVPHLRACYATYGEQTAQLALQHGADDYAPAPGAAAPAEAPDAEENPEEDVEELAELVRDAGFTPAERDGAYAVVREHAGPDPDRREVPQPMRF